MKSDTPEIETPMYPFIDFYDHKSITVDTMVEFLINFPIFSQIWLFVSGIIVFLMRSCEGILYHGKTRYRTIGWWTIYKDIFNLAYLYKFSEPFTSSKNSQRKVICDNHGNKSIIYAFLSSFGCASLRISWYGRGNRLKIFFHRNGFAPNDVEWSLSTRVHNKIFTATSPTQFKFT